MNNQIQLNTVNKLIVADQNNINLLESKIAQLSTYDATVESSSHSARAAEWAASLVTLRQGLEGLRLKHDSLMDRSTAAVL